MVPIAYERFGSGPDILLVPGQDGALSWWDPALLSDLSSHYTVTVFDLPGAGYSGPATAPLSLGWLADMTAGLVLTLGLSDPTVLGWGLGGQIAMSLAERHPGIASSLVLVDTSVGRSRRRGW
jgi:pimeloyl-ACP methyl ester carboxylesterase